MQNGEHSLYKKRIVFIGQPTSPSRREMVAKLQLAGAIEYDKVNSLTDIVVYYPSKFEKKVQKLKDAKALEQEGTLKILDVDTFIGLINSD